MAAIVVDCRPFRERSRELYKALEASPGANAVIAAIDLFGIRSTAQLDDLMQAATGYLSRFFDSHMIADTAGRILFDARLKTTSVTETDEGRVATPAFSSHVDISKLLRADPALSDRGASRTADAANNRSTTTSPLWFRGQSFVETVRVENVALRVFVHPFVLDDVDLSDDSEPSRSASRTSAYREVRPTFYMVGIVDDSEFQSAAIKLRLSLVVDGTLVLLLLLTLCPLLWFWTAGDRFVINPVGLAAICPIPVVGVVLFVVLACGIVTKRIDEYVLDNTLQVVSDRIVQLFDGELRKEIRALSHFRARASGQDAQTVTEPTTPTTGEPLSRLEKRFYCDTSIRDHPYDPERIPGLTSMLVLDDEGRQFLCWSGGALTRTPKLTLAFRDYFVRPKEGVLWRRPSSRVPDTVSCDEQSLISCVVNNSPVGSQDDQDEPNDRAVDKDNPEAPFYLDRIDSIVRGDVQTVLAINTEVMRTPVAVSGIRLNSLDRTVPPHHIDFAVVDRDTGETLFHSDDELAMATNFADDVGGAPALRSLLHSGTRETLSLDYAGIPIRAYVRPLRDRMPWALIVYRGHELEDRLAAVTTALSIFFALSWLLILVGITGLVLLAAHRWRREAHGGIACGLGRVMTTGARSSWTVGAFVGLPLVLLLYSPWLPWNPWPSSDPWLLWTARNPDDPRSISWLFAIYPVLSACLFGLYSIRRARPSTDAPKTHRVLVLAAVIACLAIVPTGLWFAHHRTTLGTGLNHYLLDRTLDSLERAREDYRLDMLREFGRGIAPTDDRMRQRPREDRAPDGSRVYEAMRPLVAFSRLSNELMTYRALLSPPEDAYKTLSVAFGHGARTSFLEYRWPLSILSLLLFVLMTLLVGFIAYTICSILTIAKERLHGLGSCPEVRMEDGRRVFCPPLQAILVYRSERERKRLIQELQTPSGAENSHEPTYVFYDLAEAMAPHATVPARLDELQRRLNDGSPLVLWSRVVPDYRYSDRFEPADRWFAVGHVDDADRRRRWNNLARELPSYVLPGTIPDERPYFDDVWAQSTMEERLQLYALSRGGVVNARRIAALSSLENRGVVEVDEAGVVRLRSAALREFIAQEVDHGELRAWRKAGGGGAWRILWPPLAIGAVLGLAFLAMANPEMRATFLTALLGLLPIVLPILRGGQNSVATATPSADQ